MRAEICKEIRNSFIYEFNDETTTSEEDNGMEQR